MHSSPWGKQVRPATPLRRQLPEVVLPARAASPPCAVCPSFAPLAVVDKPCNAGMTATGYRLAGGCVGAAYGVVEKPRCGRVCRHSGESRNPFLRLSPFVRLPAHRRGMRSRRSFTRTRKWIPAFAGMTNENQIRPGFREENAAYRRDRSRPVPTKNVNPPALVFFNSPGKGSLSTRRGGSATCRSPLLLR